MLRDIFRMEISVIFLCFISLFDLNSAGDLKAPENSLKQQLGPREDTTGAAAPSDICRLQGSARLPAFSKDGDFVIGGVFSIHRYTVTVNHNYTTMPEPFRCRVCGEENV
ncbi:hypothetical protein D4764_12G0004970 [Takifugu flavidus]|uniref:Uncharacterized protein n=1 Tax=Takifugu flavidus TaxID=433684 RepID=A0A5C6PFL5_9TELE|nr:hypothetical protein D4764_12G0004970 [Takifugu flavidus]